MDLLPSTIQLVQEVIIIPEITELVFAPDILFQVEVGRRAYDQMD